MQQVEIDDKRATGAIRGIHRMTKFIVVVFAILLSGPLLFGQDPDDVKPQASGNPEATAGKALFQQTCGFCHGPDGRGASGTDLLHSALVSHDVGGNLIGEVVRKGRPDKGMPAFPLSDSQIQQIAAFLHAQAKLASSVTTLMPSDYPLDKLLVGNVEAGKRYFNGAGKCSQCHSPTGDFAHIAGKYKPLELQSRIAFPYGKNPTVTVVDAGGRSYNGTQVYEDEFFVSLEMSDGARRTFDRRMVKTDTHDPLAAHVAMLNQYTDDDIHNLLAYLETLK
jgi:cytochrome c oxidase cbb3-type subunit 3